MTDETTMNDPELDDPEYAGPTLAPVEFDDPDEPEISDEDLAGRESTPMAAHVDLRDDA